MTTRFQIRFIRFTVGPVNSSRWTTNQMSYQFQKIANLFAMIMVCVQISCQHISIDVRPSVKTVATDVEKMIENLKKFHNALYPNNKFKNIVKVEYLFQKGKHTVESWTLISQDGGNYTYRIAIKPGPGRSFDWYIREYPES